MKTIILAVGLAVLASACNYSHVGTPITTFNRPAPPLGGATDETPSGPLVLKIRRHLDTVLRGPDDEEDQLLVLNVHDFQIGQRLKIPSESVTADFTATRFGPSSRGEGFVGSLVVKKVTAKKVEASLHLDVTAHTSSGAYTQTAKFHDDYTFLYRTADDESAP